MSESNLTMIRPLNSRFRLLDRPLAIPGKCGICGAVDRPVVDTGWSIDYYGVFYFCVSCLTEVAEIIGMVSSDLLREAELDSARQFEDQLKKRDLKVVPNEQYLSWLSIVSRLHDGLNRYVYTPDIPVITDTAPTESTTNEDVSGVVEQEPELVVDERPVSVSTSSGDGSPFGF